MTAGTRSPKSAQPGPSNSRSPPASQSRSPEPSRSSPSSASGHHLQPVRRKSKFREEEIVRVIVQSLYELGYGKSAQTLEEESGFTLESASIGGFRASLLAGSWDSAESTLGQMRLRPGEEKIIRYLIRKQKFMELLAKQQVPGALHILRTEITPLDIDQEELHRLTRYVVIGKPPQSQTSPSEMRQELLKEVEGHISSQLVIPANRLETLLEQSLLYQTNACVYHDCADMDLSLFENHQCTRSQFPCTTNAVLDEHTDEVWFVAFSPDGNYLASASKDNKVIIWSCEDWSVYHMLPTTKDPVAFLAWSPDSTFILALPHDQIFKLWNAKIGVAERTFSRHTEPVTSCAWLLDSKRFVTGGLDKTIYLWNVNGEQLFRWSSTARIQDLAIPADGSLLIAVMGRDIKFYDLAGDKSEIGVFTGFDETTSICVSSDGRYLLFNTSIQEIHLWDIRERKFLRKYVGQKQGRFLIRSCFGGKEQNFVLSGSEDGAIYIWRRESASLIELLEGHEGCVNHVAWNPGLRVFASASDDHTIRIWAGESDGPGKQE
ncbi:WD40-repeat-containing domain protein [Polychytrium aggregatum]|uniref:WD40-repeat-containing domain protein n=1 Tax=Polychytrium aggregatum TaxID=110093 RepID=UPI0022FDF7A5|nr:WD40-repeat-containing domain protein [Polychytrium aggregatum]KAI9209708.1 WD40-repeat-containing domain protein [Polychytrium aggregatum]